MNHEDEKGPPSEGPEQVYRQGTRIFHFNDPVVGMTAGLVAGSRIIGRLVQVRKFCGRFGSDVFLIRKPDGSLITLENDLLEPYDGDVPVYAGDSIEQEYVIMGKWPETGFLIESPKQPEAGGSFSMIIVEGTTPQRARRNPGDGQP